MSVFGTGFGDVQRVGDLLAPGAFEAGERLGRAPFQVFDAIVLIALGGLAIFGISLVAR